MELEDLESSTIYQLTTRNMTEDTNEPIEINVFFAIFIPLLIITTTILNLATIAAFWKLPSLRRKPGDLLILNLSVADLLTGMILLPIAAPIHITPYHWPTGELGCKFAVCFLNLCIHGSLFALTSISVDRFLLVSMEYPTYVKTVTRKAVYKIIAAGWIFVFVTVAIELGLWDKAKDIDDSAKNIPFNKVCLSPARRIQAYSLTIFSLLYMFPVLLVCGLSLGFLFLLWVRITRNKTRQMTAPYRDMRERSKTVDSSTTDLDMTEDTSGDWDAATEDNINGDFSTATKDPVNEDTSIGDAATKGPVKEDTSTEDATTATKDPVNKDTSTAAAVNRYTASEEALVEDAATKYNEVKDVTNKDTETNLKKKKPTRKTKQVDEYRQVRNRYIKPGITLFALVTAMAVCMLPYCFYVIITESGCEHCNNTKVLYALLLLQFCNACLDPFIYVLTRKKIRKFYVNIVNKFKFCKS